MPTSVSPRSSISGSARATSARTVASTVDVSAVGRDSVCERVTRV